MIVDDEPDILKLTEFRLKKAGYETVSAADGFAALEKLKGSKPDLILLDIMLPGINGYEVCKRIKQDKETCGIPILFFTAYAVIADVEEKIREFGVQGVVKKPFRTEELLEAVHGIWESSKKPS